MNSTVKVSGIVVLGVLISFALPHVITLSTAKHMEEKKQVEKTNFNIQTAKNSIATALKKDTAVPVSKTEPEEPVQEEQVEEEIKEETEENIQTTNEQVLTVAPKSYEEMTVEELINAISDGSYKLEYSDVYNTGASNRLEKVKGAIYYENHKETYYSERVLPGTSLNIPGRHVASDGTIRDGDGYICVAASTSYLSKGTIVKTSIGPAKVYDCGCASGIIDIYTNW